ncbi:MAG TPA: hypothetical protein DCG19_03180 [Cryomorphaceae bacterium]|nr:hypothetical protein [Owenweeksia sp.]HAD96380.1 hypothetical protein [Cryomorphaceae bacterium]|tara:strand:+ start:278 stop:811 length:534 start_codon:yes stop_codon:yes gene_type:complete
MKNRTSYITASIGVATFLLSFLLPDSLARQDFDQGEGDYKILTRQREDGSFSISTYQVLYDSSEVDFETYLDGMTENGLFFDRKSDGSGSYGYLKTVVLPIEQRVTSHFQKDPRYPVKVGDWFYFNTKGEVDSIITFGDFKELTFQVDTGYPENENYYYIDSIVKISYKDKKVIFKK